MFALLTAAVLPAAYSEEQDQQSKIHLRGWRDILWTPYEVNFLEIATQKRGMYLWYYEHTFFDALEKGYGIFHGDKPSHLTVGEDGRRATICSVGDRRQIKMEVEAVADGANLLLTATNTTDYKWPEIAAICPCFFPGSSDWRFTNPPMYDCFRDEERGDSYFLGADRMELLNNLDLHANHRLRPQVDRWIGAYEPDPYWTLANGDAYAGLMVRESKDGRWVAGIGWERFVSAQAHNPLRCMHLSVRLGPLAPGQTRTVRGKIYLFEGNKEDCLIRFLNDFPEAVFEGR